MKNLRKFLSILIIVSMQIGMITPISANTEIEIIDSVDEESEIIIDAGSFYADDAEAGEERYITPKNDEVINGVTFKFYTVDPEPTPVPEPDPEEDPDEEPVDTPDPNIVSGVSFHEVANESATESKVRAAISDDSILIHDIISYNRQFYHQKENTEEESFSPTNASCKVTLSDEMVNLIERTLPDDSPNTYYDMLSSDDMEIGVFSIVEPSEPLNIVPLDFEYDSDAHVISYDLRSSSLYNDNTNTEVIVIYEHFDFKKSVQTSIIDVEPEDGINGTAFEESIISEEGITLDNNFTVPTDYDSRDKLPTLRNQGKYGTGWAFACTSLAEASLIKNYGYRRSTTDLSEGHLAYFMYNSQVDPLNGTIGDGNSGKNPNIYDNGGNINFARNILASWQGSASELVAPYSVLPGDYASDIAFTDYAHLNNSYEVKSSNRTDIKKLVMQLGGVGVSLRIEPKYYNHVNNSYYYPTMSDPTLIGEANQSVVIVGWDDSFAFDRFNSTSTSGAQGGNGAWLVRNSMTTASKGVKGYNGYESLYGYFWVSYYDASMLQNPAYAFDCAPSDDYEHNYQYDGSSYTQTRAFTQKAVIANRFVVPSTSTYESLKAVTFYTENSNISYTINIYKKPSNANPENGELISKSTTTGKTTYPGFYTINLANDAIFKGGDSFSIVITLDAKSYNDVHVGYEGNLDNSWIQTVADIKAYQSYSKIAGSWEDNKSLGIGNWRIKAYTVDGSTEPESYNILYEANGATSGQMPVQVIYRNTKDRLNPVEYRRTGYEFTGWNTRADGKGISYDNTQVVYNLLQPNKTLTLYAMWKIVSYPISYTLYGGDNNPGNPSEYTVNDEVILKDPTREGYDFDGWYSDSDFSIPRSKISKNSTGRRIFFAKWVVSGYPIYYELNGGINNPENPEKYTGAGTIVLKNPTNEGYHFMGWYSDPACTNRVTEILKGTKGAITLYAKWQGYKINYVLKGGTNSENNPSTYVGDKVIYLEDASRVGYTFKGWYLDEACTQRIKDIVRGIKGDLTLYASWSKNKYNIIFDGNKASSGEMKPVYGISYNKTYKLPANKYKKTGYYFAGWCTNANGKGKIYKNKAKVKNLSLIDNETVKLYAVWKIVYYNIRFSGNGATSGTMKPLKKIPYSTKKKLPTNKFSKKGYKFIGWNTKKNGTGKWYKDRSKVTKLGKKHNKTVTLYAIWQINP